MNDRFSTCLAFVLAREGKYSNNPADSGGATMMGVTQRVYDAYRARHGLPLRDVRQITDVEVADIYRTEYWAPVCCDDLPVSVDLCVFDLAVNAGVNESAEILQRALGVTIDGHIGPQTLAAAMQPDHRALANRLLDLRAAFYRQSVADHPHNSVFLTGWLNRVQALRALI
jgi:lysozyme family protein